MKKTGLILVLLACIVGGYFIYLAKVSSSHEEEAIVPFTVMDILHATDLEQGVKKGVQNNDDEVITSWLEKAQDVAEQAGLAESDVEYLHSDQAKDYVVFNAKRQLFNDEFEQRYYALQDIEALKVKYPEAKDLFAKAETLLAKRDQIINQIALTLSNGKSPDDDDIAAAKTLWQQRYQGSEQHQE
ncbi:hypothetical protein [Alteromonas sp. C1M14]|uniref:hypothetical protein n=1 Tax=Alteromonas sp. C1M14 TaxID=2841567 RepID=UPI001C08F2D1|nr:hypothetical protein [Alteromonas sp. C1M14]MBU2978955.1 hypothetical protein [Alteromonas sp. C1M14]